MWFDKVIEPFDKLFQVLLNISDTVLPIYPCNHLTKGGLGGLIRNSSSNVSCKEYLSNSTPQWAKGNCVNTLEHVGVKHIAFLTDIHPSAAIADLPACRFCFLPAITCLHFYSTHICPNTHSIRAIENTSDPTLRPGQARYSTSGRDSDHTDNADALHSFYAMSVSKAWDYQHRPSPLLRPHTCNRSWGDSSPVNATVATVGPVCSRDAFWSITQSSSLNSDYPYPPWTA